MHRTFFVTHSSSCSPRRLRHKKRTVHRIDSGREHSHYVPVVPIVDLKTEKRQRSDAETLISIPLKALNYVPIVRHVMYVVKPHDVRNIYIYLFLFFCFLSCASLIIFFFFFYVLCSCVPPEDCVFIFLVVLPYHVATINIFST